MRATQRERPMNTTTTGQTYKRAWIGFAAATIMSLIGPRPLFVKTAYADAPTPQLHELVASGVGVVTVEQLVFDARD